MVHRREIQDPDNLTYRAHQFDEVHSSRLGGWLLLLCCCTAQEGPHTLSWLAREVRGQHLLQSGFTDHNLQVQKGKAESARRSGSSQPEVKL